VRAQYYARKTTRVVLRAYGGVVPSCTNKGGRGSVRDGSSDGPLPVVRDLAGAALQPSPKAGRGCSRSWMMSLLHSFRKSQVVSVGLLFTCLSYLANRCICAPGGCEIMPTRGHGHHDHKTASGHHHDQHDQGSPHHPDRSCCELTGTCAITITVSTPAVDPPALVTALPSVVPVSERWTTGLMAPPAELAHGPPLYLLHATLLI
jgi:hypothetical protein